MTPIFLKIFYVNNILLYTLEKFSLNLNARSFLLSKMCQKVVKKNLPCLQLLIKKDNFIYFPQIHQIAKMFCTVFK